MSESALPSEVLEILERAAAHPAGLELLERGGVEAVAVLFGARPASIERARELAADPRRREALAEALSRARPSQEPRAAPAGAAVQKTADELLQEIARYPGGRELLAHSPAETVAVLFGAHPFVVAQARERAGT